MYPPGALPAFPKPSKGLEYLLSNALLSKVKSIRVVLGHHSTHHPCRRTYLRKRYSESCPLVAFQEARSSPRVDARQSLGCLNRGHKTDAPCGIDPMPIIFVSNFTFY